MSESTVNKPEMSVPERYGEDYLPLYRCGKCKEPVPRRAKFCLECGTPLDWEGIPEVELPD